MTSSLGRMDSKSSIIKEIDEGLEKLADRKQVLAMRKSKKDLPSIIKDYYPSILQDAALLLSAKPVTQVSVERLFSALKIFKQDRRNRLKESVLNALLLLRANQ